VCEEKKDHFNFYSSPILYVFLAVGNILLLQWFWGALVYILNHVGIDYVAIFGE